jgi:hypothetical protein
VPQHERRVQRHQHGGDVLDQDGDPDRQALDREEVEEPHAVQPEQRERDEVGDLSQIGAEHAGARGEENGCEAGERARDARLREQRAVDAGAEHDLRDGGGQAQSVAAAATAA